jgi:pteridine reductase
MERTLESRVAVVTGAGIRLGRAIALALGSRGAGVVVHCRSSRSDAQEVAADVRVSGSRAEVVEADLTDSSQVARVFEAADRMGGCDLLVNSAAVFERRPLEDIGDVEWRRMIDTNLTAPFFCARAAASSMRRKGRGDIVNLVDVGGGLRPFSGYAHYCAAKAGLSMLTQCLALELAPTVRVNAVAPGTVLFPEGYDEPQRQRVVHRIPLGRIGSPGDVVRAVLFLVEGSDFVTGQILAVDGGRSIA